MVRGATKEEILRKTFVRRRTDRRRYVRLEFSIALCFAFETTHRNSNTNRCEGGSYLIHVTLTTKFNYAFLLITNHQSIKTQNSIGQPTFSAMHLLLGYYIQASGISALRYQLDCKPMSSEEKNPFLYGESNPGRWVRS